MMYIKKFVNSLIKSKVNIEKDNRKTILVKIKNSCGSDILDEIKPLLTKYWSIEKPIVANILDLIEERGNDNLNNLDYSQIGNPIMYRTPERRFIKMSDCMFTPCKRCNSRLYPEFKFCPHCGASTEKELDIIDPVNFDPNNFNQAIPCQENQSEQYTPQSPQDMQVPQGMQKVMIPVNTTIQCSNNSNRKVIVEDKDIGRLLKSDIDKEIAGVKKYIP